MARNKAYDIVAFEGGINTHADARDIEDNQVAMLKNLIATNKGVLRAGYSNSALDTSLYPVLATGGSHGTLNNKNIYVYKTDFNADNENVFTEYLLFANRRKLYRLEYSSNSWSWVEILDLNFSAGGSLNPGLIVFDGNIRYSDGTFNLNTNSPYLPLNKTLFYGQVRRKYFTATENTVSTITGNASVIKPTDGKIVFNDNIETASNNPTRGFLGLEIDAIENTDLQINSFGTSDGRGFSSTGPNPSRFSNSLDYSNKNGIVGQSFSNAVDSVFVDTHGKSYTESQLQGSNTSTAQFLNSGSESGLSNIYQIGGTSASELNYIFISIDPRTYNSNWGKDSEYSNTYNFTVRYNGAFLQYAANTWDEVNWQYTDYSPSIHKVNDDGTIGDSVAIVSSDNNQTGFLEQTFLDLDVTATYRITLRTAANEMIELQNIQLFHRLAPDTLDSSDSRILFNISESASSSDTSFRAEFNGFFNTTMQTSENLILVRCSFPYDTNADSVDFIITDDDNYSSSNENFIFSLGQGYITENKGLGWQDVIIDLNKIGVIEGNPIIGQCPDFVIRVNFATNPSSSSSQDILVDSVRQVTDNRGTWNGNYKFYYSWVYDRNQETGYYEFDRQRNGISLQSERLGLKTIIRELSSGGFGSRGKRITGANIYYKEYDKDRQEEVFDDPFLLAKCDFEKGVIKSQGTSINAWSLGSTATDHYTHTALQFIDPSLSNTFSINAGYDYDPLNTIEEIRFKTATSLNRRVYYGNIDIVWEKESGEVNSKYNRYGDRIYKSLPNKPDIVPAYNFLEVDVNDGDEITALVSYADRLLVFKKEVMYIINATKELEYLEDTHTHKGVVSNQSITEIDFGIAWANLNGCYVYDGEKVIDLSKEKISTSTWGSYVGSSPVITFEPKERHLLISNKDTALGLVYNMNKEAFSLSTSFVAGDKSTNLVFYKNQIIQGIIDSNNNDQVTFKKLDLDYTSSSTLDIHLKTKDFALNEVGAKADIKSIYLTYKATTSQSNAIVASYYPNKSTIPVALTNGTLASSPSGYTTVQLIPNPKTGGRSVFSIQLQIASTSAARDIEIHDISIVYKEKSLR